MAGLRAKTVEKRALFINSYSFLNQDKNEIPSSDEEVAGDDSEPSSLDKLIRRLLTVLTEHKGMCAVWA